jgi:hypothetical protein
MRSTKKTAANAPRQNETGLDLSSAVLMNFRDGLLADTENSGRAGIYDQFQKDPVGFGEQVLKEHFTDDIKKVMESVRDNVVTLAESANAVGKTHGVLQVLQRVSSLHRGSST